MPIDMRRARTAYRYHISQVKKLSEPKPESSETISAAAADSIVSSKDEAVDEVDEVRFF